MSLTLYINNKPGRNKVITKNGSCVTLYLDPILNLDQKKQYYLRLLSGSIVYCQPNIIAGKNNKFVFCTNSNDLGSAEYYICYLDTGIYSLSDLNDKVNLLTMNEVGQSLFYFSANESTSKVNVFFSQPNTAINVSDSDGIMKLLGFNVTLNNHGLIGGFTTITDTSYVESNNKAQLNSIQNILVKTDIVDNCSYLNDHEEPIIGSIQPNTGPFGTIFYTPEFPQKCILGKNNIDKLTIELTDQDGVALDMTGSVTNQTDYEIFTLQIEIDTI